MSSSTMTDALRITATLCAAAVTGLNLGFSIIQVPVAMDSQPDLTPKQRYWIWRAMFQRGQATIPTSIFPTAALMAAAAACVEAGLHRNLLIAGTASLLSIGGVTPVVMLGANLRADLLNSVKTAEDEAQAEKMVARFQLFNSGRIALSFLATIFASYELYLK